MSSMSSSQHHVVDQQMMTTASGLSSSSVVALPVQVADPMVHYKRLAQILRYIASMHQSNSNTNSSSNNNNDDTTTTSVKDSLFVREMKISHLVGTSSSGTGQQVSGSKKSGTTRNHRATGMENHNKIPSRVQSSMDYGSLAVVPNFFQHNSPSIIFTTDQFRDLIIMDKKIEEENGGAMVYKNELFNFYAANNSSNNKNNTNEKKGSSGTSFWNKRVGNNGLGSSITKNKGTGGGGSSGGGCWLRLTRLSNSQLPVPPPVHNDRDVQKYLNDWLLQYHNQNEDNNDDRMLGEDEIKVMTTQLSDLLTLERLENPTMHHVPKISVSTYGVNGVKKIQLYLKKYKHYLRQLKYQKQLQPMYNRLFTWIQDDHIIGSSSTTSNNSTNDSNNTNNTTSSNLNGCSNELVWGLGHAKMMIPIGTDNSHGTTKNTMLVINGPLLEVLVQVELAPDGALLIRPRNHTGVTLNREVTTALAAAASNANTTTTSASESTSSSFPFEMGTSSSVTLTSASTNNNNNSNAVLSTLHKMVSEMEPWEISPGQPSTYAPILKRIALEMSANGIFQSSSTSAAQQIHQHHRPSSSSSPTSSKQNHHHDPNNNNYNNHNNKLIVTEAWCLYTRPKPSSVWARDATIFAEQVNAFMNQQQKQHHPTSGFLSKATYSFTHGPGSLEYIIAESQGRINNHKNQVVSTISGNPLKWIRDIIWKQNEDDSNSINNPLNRTAQRDSTQQLDDPNNNTLPVVMKPIFPLPASESQNRIAQLLLQEKYPAVVCEGPPGTGKSHTIANMICSYLCLGKRVLVTSKNSSALSVLRCRLPRSIQELCVDVSCSEIDGMRHLQQTVEKLAIRIASVNTQYEYEKFMYLKATMNDLEREIEEIDAKLSSRSETIRQFVRSHDGQRLITFSISLMNETPWLMRTMTHWDVEQVKSLYEQTKRLTSGPNGSNNSNFSHYEVSGYVLPIPDELISYLSYQSGNASLSAISSSTRLMFAKIPVLGTMSGVRQQTNELIEACNRLMINGCAPQTKIDWNILLEELKRIQALDKFQTDVWSTYRRKDGWPARDFLGNLDHLKEFHELLEKVITMKEIEESLNIQEHMKIANENRSLNARRSVLATKLQSLAEELVDATVVAKLSQNFSSDAQSALIRFAQLAGKQNFSQTSKLSKMTVRQRRRRQDYLEAFDRCCRFIPCWIMTTSQISDYLPPECLFDLAIIDESSQSDITALPGLLRGSQWLIVGDGKQVSPTESFISEDTFESLRASLPPVPFESSMLPGQSFFDLCSQAFPKGRVVLNEHFRCAPEIISFSNDNFYNEELVPMRLPTKSERIKPSIVDVRVPNGTKVGKSNREEASAIVKHIAEIVSKSSKLNPRSIGVISLMGSEQSQLIRTGLLEAIGPHEIARHNILVGDPPTFQGAERDIIFLSMVCSKGSAPTQSQLMHFQRANVAMSRARDQLILYRSIDIQDIPSNDDMKIPILEFFLHHSTCATNNQESNGGEKEEIDLNSSHNLLERLLVEKGYTVHTMGNIWKNGISVEHDSCDSRVGLIVECVEDSLQEWYLSYKQQKAIERVGWKCMRIDIVSLVLRLDETLGSVIRFLFLHGIEQPTILYDQLDDESVSSKSVNRAEHLGLEVYQKDDSPSDNENQSHNSNETNQAENDAIELQAVDEANDVIIVSSDDDADNNAKSLPKKTVDDSFDRNDTLEASAFGETVGLDFLRGPGASDVAENDEMQEYEESNDFTWDDENTEEYSKSDESRGKNRKRVKRHSEGVKGKKHKPYDSTKRIRRDSSERDAARDKLPVADQMDDTDSTGSDAQGKKDAKKQSSPKRISVSRKDKHYKGRDDSSTEVSDSKNSLDNANETTLKRKRQLRLKSKGQSSSTDTAASLSSVSRRRKGHRRLDKYERDGRWYPIASTDQDNDDDYSYDTVGDTKKMTFSNDESHQEEDDMSLNDADYVDD